MKYRRWQVTARDVVKALRLADQERVLIAVTPGGGKTKFAVSLAADDLLEQVVDCIVVVVPSRAIKALWKKAFKEAGIIALTEIDNSTLEENRARGLALIDPARPVFIVTYQQVCMTTGADIFAALCSRFRIFAVFDEIHHASDVAEFGQKLVYAFSDAVFKLSLSGTPFNTKGTNLAFCDCEQRVDDDGRLVNRTRSDFEYSYGAALCANGSEDDPYVVRPVTFLRWYGQARWRMQSITDPAQFTERVIDGQRKSDSLFPLLDPEGDYFKKMIQAALTELEEVRKHHANAGLLITTIDADHCERVANLVRACGVRDVVMVRHDIPGAHDLLENFAKSRDRVLVAIKMVAEGVDIKRLRVGVYASDILTQMYFMQFVGRFIRWDDSLTAGQFATILIPEHVTLLKWAEDIERMVLEAMIPEDGPGGGPREPKIIVVEKASDGALHGAIQHGLFYEPSITDELKAWAREAGVSIDIATLEKLRRAAPRAGQSTIDLASLRAEIPEPDESKRNDQLVGRIVMYAKRYQLTQWTYETVNAWANRQVGIPFKNKLTPVQVLKDRGAALHRLLSLVRTGKADDSSVA